jgi:hypothetical protein
MRWWLWRPPASEHNDHPFQMYFDIWDQLCCFLSASCPLTSLKWQAPPGATLQQDVQLSYSSYSASISSPEVSIHLFTVIHFMQCASSTEGTSRKQLKPSQVILNTSLKRKYKGCWIF